jgi:mannosyl-oligosaccharide alpha-1,2-mannosidase
MITDSQQLTRFLSVQSSIRHAWAGYKTTILDPYHHSLAHLLGTSLPADDLQPLTRTGKTWLHSAATLFDSLDTLYLAGMHDEFQEAVNLVLSLPLPLYPTKTFEYSIRVLGGLLGAFSVSGDGRLLDYAEFVADALLDGAFRSSPTVLPRMFDVLAPPRKRGKRKVRWIDWGGAWLHRMYAALYRYGRDCMGQHRVNSLAGVGSFALEFSYLSYWTGDARYKKASDDIFEWMQHKIQIKEGQGDGGRMTIKGMIAQQWDVMTGDPFMGSLVGLGSGSDSYYEYLIKSAVLLQPLKEDVDVKKLESYVKVVQESFFTLEDSTAASSGLFVSQEEQVVDVSGSLAKPTTATIITYPVQYGYEYDHLLCYVPGMIALGENFYKEKIKYHGASNRVIAELGTNLTLGCRKTYINTPTHLGPERMEFHKGRKMMAITRNAGYYLRPEYVESLFVLYRTTRDEKYRDMAWEVFESLEKYCKFDIGYASLKNVNSVTRQSRINEMPSYFLAETLKYLLLIFAPVDYVGLDEFVFTTEAHPLRQLHTMTNPLDNSKCERPEPVIHQPISNIFVLGFYSLVMILCYLIMKRFRRISRKNQSKKRQ